MFFDNARALATKYPSFAMITTFYYKIALFQNMEIGFNYKPIQKLLSN